ncbi:hypothetical protein ACQCT6_10050 [Cytobacillus gottheilii]|uniref:hypothetical protein n=1 Tax=Cytobacillus gottheilii TaxID=859144 RepID=UPI003CE6D999
MKTKNIIIVLSVLLNITLGILFYIETQRSGPVDVGFDFKEAVRLERYTDARNLMTEERIDAIPEDTLKKVNEMMSSGTSFKTYQLLEFTNGEMVLLNLTPNKEYEIQNVTIVPDEMKSVFSEL